MIAARLAAAYPKTNSGRSVVVLPRTGMTAEERADMSRVPRLLIVAVLLLPFTACGNVWSWIWVSACSNPTSNPITTAAISTGDDTIRMIMSASLTFPRMLS